MTELTTEGFYDTALKRSERSFESREDCTNANARCLPTKVCRRPSVKTMLADTEAVEKPLPVPSQDGHGNPAEISLSPSRHVLRIDHRRPVPRRSQSQGQIRIAVPASDLAKYAMQSDASIERSRQNCQRPFSRVSESQEFVTLGSDPQIPKRRPPSIRHRRREDRANRIRFYVIFDGRQIGCVRIASRLYAKRLDGSVTRPTEGFYDTAPNEAVEFESRKIVPARTHVAYQRQRCAEGLA